MSWANFHIEKLSRGETVQFRPKGNSMTGKIENGQLCTVEPLKGPPEPGDIVLCTVRGNQLVHLVTAIREGQFQISNNKNFVNGWITLKQIHGKLVRVEP